MLHRMGLILIVCMELSCPDKTTVGAHCFYIIKTQKHYVNTTLLVDFKDICNDYLGICSTLAKYWLVMRFSVTG